MRGGFQSVSQVAGKALAQALRLGWAAAMQESGWAAGRQDPCFLGRALPAERLGEQAGCQRRTWSWGAHVGGSEGWRVMGHSLLSVPPNLCQALSKGRPQGPLKNVSSV